MSLLHHGGNVFHAVKVYVIMLCREKHLFIVVIYSNLYHCLMCLIVWYVNRINLPLLEEEVNFVERYFEGLDLQSVTSHGDFHHFNVLYDEQSGRFSLCILMANS